MEFQKERVFTALNADELKVGSKVIVADSIFNLRERVDEYRNIGVLEDVESDDIIKRFVVDSTRWNLAYLVSEPETWIAYISRRKGLNPRLTACRSDKWEIAQKDYGAKTKLFEGTEDETDKWYTDRIKFTDIMAAWEDGKIIQYDSGYGWTDCCDNRPAWDTTSEYRVKPEGLKWTDLKIGDIIRSGEMSYMITGIDAKNVTQSHVHFAGKWRVDFELEGWEKVE